MNKLKQAIAYLLSKIRTAYWAARFSLSVITLEYPYGWQRMDGRTRIKTENLRRASGEPSIASFDRPSESDSQAVIIESTIPNRATPSETADFSCCGLFSFADRDSVAKSGDKDRNEPAAAKGHPVKNLPSRETFDLGESADWDLLSPRDRRSIILNAMRSRQADTEYFELFSVRCVMELCDRADVEWNSVFDELWALKKQGKVTVFVSLDESGKKFNGFFWGLR